MALTPAQNTIVKAYIDADPVLSVIPNTYDGAYDVAKALNLYPVADFLVWRTEAPVQDIINALDGSKYTPSDTIPTTTTELSQIYQSRILACQTKQISLQTLIIGRESINASKANVRNWLKDAVVQVPAGASGAFIQPGGANGTAALTACLRKATVIEKLLSVGSAETGVTTGNLLGFEGAISYLDVFDARRV